MVIGNSLALVRSTAKKTLSKLPPANNISAITNCPGKANAKKVDKKLSKRLKPELFKKTPNVNILSPSPKTGIPRELEIPLIIGPVNKKLIIVPLNIYLK